MRRLTQRLSLLAATYLFVSAFSVHAQSSTVRELTLAQIETLVLRANRDVQAARRALEGAEAQIRQADVLPNPVVSFSSTGINSNPGVGSGSWNNKRIDNIYRVDQTIERGNKRALRVDAAQRLEMAARGDVSDVLRQQLLAARSAYVDLQQAQEKNTLMRENAELFAKTLAVAQTRLKAGDISPADVARVQVDAERASADLRGAEAERVRAQFALAFLIGEEAQASQLRAAESWPANAPVRATSIETTVEARADVRAAQSRFDATERLRELARSQRTRDVSVGAQFERYAGNVPANSVGFGVSVPLFFGNDFSGDIQRAEVDRNTALDQLARVRAAAATEIARADSDLRAAGERVERYEGSLLAAARRTAEAAEFAFARGATSVLEVLDARRTLRAVQLEALAARAEHARALHAWRASITAASTSVAP